MINRAENPWDVSTWLIYKFKVGQTKAHISATSVRLLSAISDQNSNFAMDHFAALLCSIGVIRFILLVFISLRVFHCQFHSRLQVSKVEKLIKDGLQTNFWLDLFHWDLDFRAKNGSFWVTAVAEYRSQHTAINLRGLQVSRYSSGVLTAWHIRRATTCAYSLGNQGSTTDLSKFFWGKFGPPVDRIAR